jgi:hypothetical protein
MFSRKSLSMALHLAMQTIAQPAISQPPDQAHVGRRGRQAVRNLRASWTGFLGGWARRTTPYRSPDESRHRINAAAEKRARRCARNLADAQLRSA